MIPTSKALEIDALIDSMLPTKAGRRGSILANRCASCSNVVMGFRDPLSAKEYRISGMCQRCQDNMFGGDE